MEWFIVLKDYVPLFQTLVWALLIVFLLSLFRKPLAKVFYSLQQRISGDAGGASIKASLGSFVSIEIGEDLRKLEQVSPSDKPVITLTDTQIQQWTEARVDIYTKNRGVFLVHVLKPSQKPGQKFDIFMFLIGHHDAGALDKIAYAEFFFGKHWGNRVIKVEKKGDLIGLSTSAYGPFLAICLVVFTDGYKVTLNHYIDFEMGKQVVTLQPLPDVQ